MCLPLPCVSSNRSLSSVSNPTGGFSTLSPLSSPASNFSSAGEEMGEGGGRRRLPPSPGTLEQLEGVKAQLTDALRALAVAFGDVGYCQGAGGRVGFAAALVLQ